METPVSLLVLLNCNIITQVIKHKKTHLISYFKRAEWKRSRLNGACAHRLSTQRTRVFGCFICYKKQKTDLEKPSRHLIMNFMKLKCDIPVPPLNPIPNSSEKQNSVYPSLTHFLPGPTPSTLCLSPPLFFLLYLEPVDSRAMSPEEALMDRM